MNESLRGANEGRIAVRKAAISFKQTTQEGPNNFRRTLPNQARNLRLGTTSLHQTVQDKEVLERPIIEDISYRSVIRFLLAMNMQVLAEQTIHERGHVIHQVA